MVLRGLAGVFGWSEPVMHKLVRPENRRYNPLFEAEVQERLDTPLREIAAAGPGTAWNNARSTMGYAGLGTAGDVLAVGLDFVSNLRGIGTGTKALETVTSVLRTHVPEYPLPPTPVPQDIARLRPSLRQVTWLVLRAIDDLPFYPSTGPQPSVEGVLTRPYQELGLLAGGDDANDTAKMQAALTESARRFVSPYRAGLSAYSNAPDTA